VQFHLVGDSYRDIDHLEGCRQMRTSFLFSDVSIFDVLQHQQVQLRKELERLDPPTVERVNEEEIIRQVAVQYKMDVPVLVEDSAYTSHREVDVDVSRDPMRMIFDRDQPFYIRGTEINISVPFKGNSEFFRIRPSTFTMNPPRAEVQGQELKFVYTRTDANAAAVKTEYENSVREINQHLGWLRASVEDFNSKIEQQIRPLLAQRKQKISGDAGMIAALGLPTKKNQPASEFPSPRKPESIRKSITSVKKWDVFISHASEDKNSIARPLAKALASAGVSVWYDEFSLKLGDSLRGSIDFGLANSRYGVVIFSKNFFAKHWPVQELNGLVGREVGGHKIVLPIWHDVKAEEVREFSPILADRVAVQSSEGMGMLVQEIMRALEND
jgi:TIR domain